MDFLNFEKWRVLIPWIELNLILFKLPNLFTNFNWAWHAPMSRFPWWRILSDPLKWSDKRRWKTYTLLSCARAWPKYTEKISDLYRFAWWADEILQTPSYLKLVGFWRCSVLQLPIYWNCCFIELKMKLNWIKIF